MSMETLYCASVPVILWMQQMLPPFQDLLFGATAVADPGYVVCVLFPLCYSLKPGFGRRILWGIIIAEWLNLNLKWSLHGHRPYWWVKETDGYNESRPQFKQHQSTCETGSGSPSGHAMAMASAGFILCYKGIQELKSHVTLTRLEGNVVSFVIWAAYLITLVTIDVSRIYIATHFPHQVILGNLLGMLTGYVVVKFPINRFTFHQYMAWVVVIAATTMTTYYLLLNYAYDPNWSMEMAQKWCDNPAWVKATTSPFHTLARVTGALFGLGLGVGLTDYILDSKKDRKISRRVKLLCAPSATIFAFMLEHVRVPDDNLSTFYIMSFLKICALAFLVSGLMPNIFSSLLDDYTIFESNRENGYVRSESRSKMNGGTLTNGISCTDKHLHIANCFTNGIAKTGNKKYE